MSLSIENKQKLIEARKTALVREALLYVMKNFEGILSNDVLYPRTATIIRGQFVKSGKKLGEDFYKEVANEIVITGAYDGEEFK